MAKKKKTFRDYTALGSISAQLILKNLPFVLFLGFLATVYIANAHYSEKTVRDIQKMQEEIKELRWKYMSLQAEIMYNSKETEVQERVEPLGLGRKGSGPRRIVVKEE